MWLTKIRVFCVKAGFFTAEIICMNLGLTVVAENNKFL